MGAEPSSIAAAATVEIPPVWSMCPWVATMAATVRPALFMERRIGAVSGGQSMTMHSLPSAETIQKFVLATQSGVPVTLITLLSFRFETGHLNAVCCNRRRTLVNAAKRAER